MKPRAVLFGILVVSLVAIFALAAPADDVRADTGCQAKINGVDVINLGTPGNALEVQKDEIVVVELWTSDPITDYKIDLYFTGIRPFWTVKDTDESTDTYLRSSVDVSKYAKYGLGLYKVVAVATLEGGYTCSETAYIRVVGGSFMTTVMGPIALFLTIVGSIGLLLLVFLIWAHPERLPCCGPITPIAILLTMMAMVTGGTGIPSSGDQTTGAGDMPQAPSGGKDTSGGGKKFRLRILIPTIGCALLSAIGFLMLFQQMGVVFPTITIVVLSLVLAFVAGIVLPLLAMRFSRMRK
ncbi:hypothetical protein ACFLXA_00520 [Chloroflexota bacterium]